MSAHGEGLKNIARFITIRVLSILIITTIGLYIVILIANWGGALDELRRHQIHLQISMNIMLSPEYQSLPYEERQAMVDQHYQFLKARYGLDRSFFQRSLIYLFDSIFLRLGRSQRMISNQGSYEVRDIILERIPYTLLLFLTTYLVLFSASLLISLRLSRKFGNLFDKLVVILVPLSSAPSWFFGVILIAIFAGMLQIMPFSGFVKSPPPSSTLAYTISIMHHMVLPVLAILISTLFFTIYYWRTFFLIFADEDYVEIAKAKGLSPALLERRYILRPTLPAILTQFILQLIGLWTSGIILEMVFNWPGIGYLFYLAVYSGEMAVTVGLTVIYAYILAFSILMLDIAYAIVDPRIRVANL